MTAMVERWFGRHGRDLPWRATPRDAYRSLVSEVMLQQTQVSRVLPRYGAFLAAFPGLADLAAADEHDVLAAWTGLGYYRRARLLHAAARAVVGEHGGRMPESAEVLRRLPGVGAYTAGAIASIVHGRAEPIVDGNIARVLMRVHGRPGRHQDSAVMKWAWGRAAELVVTARRPGVFNEGMMELGAVVCTPRSPRCGACPLAKACVARACGRQEEIPMPKARAERTRVHCATAMVRDGRHADAARVLEAVVEPGGRPLAVDDPEAVKLRLLYANVLAGGGDHARAAGVFMRLGDDLAARFGVEDERVVQCRLGEADCDRARGDDGLALRLLRGLLAEQLDVRSAEDPRVLELRRRVGELEAEVGDHAAARRTLADLHDDLSRDAGPDHPSAIRVRGRLERLGP
jgi:A/G-specific adenine glycosylase